MGTPSHRYRGKKYTPNPIRMKYMNISPVMLEEIEKNIHNYIMALLKCIYVIVHQYHGAKDRLLVMQVVSVTNIQSEQTLY